MPIHKKTKKKFVHNFTEDKRSSELQVNFLSTDTNISCWRCWRFLLGAYPNEWAGSNVCSYGTCCSCLQFDENVRDLISILVDCETKINLEKMAKGLSPDLTSLKPSGHHMPTRIAAIHLQVYHTNSRNPDSCIKICVCVRAHVCVCVCVYLGLACIIHRHRNTQIAPILILTFPSSFLLHAGKQTQHLAYLGRML